jgi:hypothetical protein
MPTSRDELAQLNFGYLKGSDLLQFAPIQLLTSQYEKYPDVFQQGCSMAYDEINGELIARYDVQKELSNSNQKLKSQTGAIQVTIPAASFVGRVILNWDSGVFTPATTRVNTDISPLVSIGTTEGGDEYFSDNIQNQKVAWLNRYFDLETILYFTIEGGSVNIDISCNRLNLSPTFSVIEQTALANFTLNIPANTYITRIFGKIVLDTPSISVGTTLGGTQVCAATTVSNAEIAIKANMNYYASATTLYFTVALGTVDLRIDLGYNYVDHTVVLTQPRNNLFVKLTTILAIRNILGSIAGDNKILCSHFDWMKETLEKIKNRQMSITLDSAPITMAGRARTISSEFKTLG